MSKFLTVKEVAERLEVSDRTVRNWISKGILSAHRFGKLIKISESDITDFINESKSNNEKENEKS